MQAFNPFLPLYECVPDGEPHVFGDRVYIYGSHDKLGGETFCMLDYVVYSAAIDNLKEWRYEGITYSAKQDPLYCEERKYMYAPDVVQGNDGRYYLYYALSGDFGVGGYHGPISVAVCDSPAGKYKYLGVVKYADGSVMNDYVCFDPGVINDNGTIRIYYGTQYMFEEENDIFTNEDLINQEMSMFGKTREQILDFAKNKQSTMGAIMLTVEDDMLTVKDNPKHIIPYKIKGTDFEQHGFFEASSIRKVNGKYYFIYSSMKNHELCYAVSDYPDRDFKFGGTIVSNGDVGFNGREDKDRLNMTGTTHGSIENINGEWYVFYHRLTHKSDYSRQACAEKIKINADGSIDQVEITSCGLNGGALIGKGIYPASIACNITNGNMPHGSNKIYDFSFPNVNHRTDDKGNITHFIAEISDNTMIGFKYFDFDSLDKITLTLRGNFKGNIKIATAEKSDTLGELDVSLTDDFKNYTVDIKPLCGVKAIYLFFKGEGMAEFLEIGF